MGVILHWFLPTNGDSRTDLSLGNAVGAAGSRATAGGTEGGAERAPDISYIGQIARSAEQLGFTGALTPTSSWPNYVTAECATGCSGPPVHIGGFPSLCGCRAMP